MPRTHFAAVHWRPPRDPEDKVVEVSSWKELGKVLAQAVRESNPTRPVGVEVGLGTRGEVYPIHASAGTLEELVRHLDDLETGYE